MKLSETRDTVSNIIRSFGLTDAGLVLENFDLISNNKTIFNDQVKKYIKAPKKDGTYPLYKLLIAISVFSGNLPISTTEPIKQQLMKDIKCKISKYYIQSAISLNVGDQPMLKHLDRITFNPKIMAGNACIRGMQIPVSLILNLVANGKTTEEIIEDYPDLEPEDIRQS
jgi:uncharacterized protein (DUF433 family)